ncbi:hypothetical protein MMC22_009464 [Lobaria immixta]|nr:hypothetical protein [Lobaria immixta]
MPRANRQIRLPSWTPFPGPHHVMQPKWNTSTSPNRTCASPAEPNSPAAPIFTVQVKSGQTIIDILDMLEDTEFEHVLSRTKKNAAAIRLLEKELQQARAKPQAKAADEVTSSRDVWDFTERSETAIRNEQVSYEMSLADKARKGIEAISPKSTKKNVASHRTGAGVGKNRARNRGRPSKYAVESGLATYEIRLTDRTRKSIEAVSPKAT